jgi:hypothetical protein
MSWTQPICDPCWKTEEGDREPTRLLPNARSIEKCCYCGRDTLSGIYVRRDPATVYFPADD